MDEIQQAARVAFATEYAFYLKAHEFHWNITGPNFFQYHQLFGEIYQEVYGVLDGFAEKVRSLGAYAPGSFSKLSMLSRVDGEDSIPSQEEMVAQLLEDSEKIIGLFKIVYKVAETSNMYGFSNFLAERIDKHAKHSWMLRSCLR